MEEVKYYSDSEIPITDPRHQEDVELDECYAKKEKCVDISIMVTISVIVLSSMAMFITQFAI